MTFDIQAIDNAQILRVKISKGLRKFGLKFFKHAEFINNTPDSILVFYTLI